METMDFSETIAACDLKACRFRQVIELMKVYDFWRSMSFLDLGPRSFTNEIKTCFFQLGHFYAPNFEIVGSIFV